MRPEPQDVQGRTLLGGVPNAVDTLTALWTLAVLITMVSVPMACVRGYAYFSGERDHTRTMWIAMIVAVAIAAVALAAVVGLSIARIAD
jgi:hypothetical protein